jgi:hypothetical protein
MVTDVKHFALMFLTENGFTTHALKRGRHAYRDTRTLAFIAARHSHELGPACSMKFIEVYRFPDSLDLNTVGFTYLQKLSGFLVGVFTN